MKNMAGTVDEKKVYKLVLTGGPCGGKTTGQARLCTFFENLGWKVFRVPETATVLLSGGIKFSDLTADEEKSGKLTDHRTVFKDGYPEHSVDKTASCPRCLAAAAEKPNGSEGMRRTVLSVLLLVSAAVVGADVPSGVPTNVKKERQRAEKLPPCKACSVLVNSFREGMKRTERSKHEGGDAAWEEERLGSYKTSELRLIEIQERLCQDVGRGEDQCHQLAEDYESRIEEWWKQHQNDHPDLHRWLCEPSTSVFELTTFGLRVQPPPAIPPE
uniref:DUF3456 domain-containing protein n=1 Tax=Culex quinquefasciatus TaxID=7176 RepID=A0A1S4J1H5_CULQU